jgi:hypothetical protein
VSIDQQQQVTPASFIAFLNKLEKKRGSMSEKEFLQHIFTKTHQAYLKRYAPYSSFSSLFIDGSYHCLSGTILYSLILKEFEIQHEVIETNYHIFLMADTNDGKVLIEATDPQFGFVDSPAAIEKRINTYRQQQVAETSGTSVQYRFNADLFRTVSLYEMAGLLYYNKSVDLLNKGDLKASVEFAVKANELYSSERMDEFSQILLLSVQQSTMSADQKKHYLRMLLTVKQLHYPAVASVY